MKKENKDKQERVALFPGSFDPFTIGHASLVKRGLALADRIIIAVGINEKKQGYFPAEERLEAIRKLYADNPRVEVRSYQTLTTDLARETEADFILRGIRSVIDFEYEKTIADVNRTLTGIETIFLPGRTAICAHQFECRPRASLLRKRGLCLSSRRNDN